MSDNRLATFTIRGAKPTGKDEKPTGKEDKPKESRTRITTADQTLPTFLYRDGTVQYQQTSTKEREMIRPGYEAYFNQQSKAKQDTLIQRDPKRKEQILEYIDDRGELPMGFTVLSRQKQQHGPPFLTTDEETEYVIPVLKYPNNDRTYPKTTRAQRDALRPEFTEYFENLPDKEKDDLRRWSTRPNENVHLTDDRGAFIPERPKKPVPKP